MISLKNFIAWLVACAGALLILSAPWNLKGLGMAAAGVILLVGGLIPAMKGRRLARLEREEQLAREEDAE